MFNDEKPTSFDCRIATQNVLTEQSIAVAPSQTSEDVLFKQLWSK